MKSLFLSVPFLLLTIAPANAASWQEITGREHAIAVLLLSKADFDITLGAKGVYRSNANSPEILDLAAEITWAACSAKQKMDDDTLSWLGKALGSSKQARYAALLDACLSDPANDKSKKHLTRAREQLTGTAASSFEGGKLDLAQIRNQLEAKPSDLSTQPAPKFNTPEQRRSIDAAYAVLGKPDGLAGEKVSKGKVGRLFVKVKISDDMITLHYNTLGKARFIYDETRNDWVLYATEDDPLLFWLRKDGRFVDLSQAIAHGDGPQLQGIAGILIKQKNFGRELLDQIATRLHHSRQEDDDDVADGLAWLCRVIGESRDGRYKPFLLELSEKASEKVLRKYASKAADKLKDKNEAKYVPPAA